MKANFELRAQAREALQDNWGNAVLATLVYWLIACVAASIPFFNFVATILFLIPFSLAYIVLFYGFYKGKKSGLVEGLFAPFNTYGRTLGLSLLVAVYTYLWTLLLIIPGIIKHYSYAMAFYIAQDEPTLSAEQAIQKSMQIMRGNKAKLFCLDLSFIGWALLCVLTCGIGYLWLAPYVATARAAFYEDLKYANAVNY
ncbi:membrane protein [Bacteroidia bacterium]|nr:membrane protein [Bacteroidia bacterium]